MLIWYNSWGRKLRVICLVKLRDVFDVDSSSHLKKNILWRHVFGWRVSGCRLYGINPVYLGCEWERKWRFAGEKSHKILFIFIGNLLISGTEFNALGHIVDTQINHSILRMHIKWEIHIFSLVYGTNFLFRGVFHQQTHKHVLFEAKIRELLKSRNAQGDIVIFFKFIFVFARKAIIRHRADWMSHPSLVSLCRWKFPL